MAAQGSHPSPLVESVTPATAGLCEGAPGVGLLCEGSAGCFIPEVTYVVQDDKVCLIEGDFKESDNLMESTSAGALTLVEDISKLDLEERTGSDGKKYTTVKNGTWIVEGPYQRSDTKNANKRVYPRAIWESLIGNPKSDVQERVKARAMVGHLEHPKDGRMDGKEGALVVTKLHLREDGVVWGQSELLDTPNGLILQEYTRKKVRWGVSSRGNGSVDETGKVSEADYKLATFDAVMNPSTPGAFSKVKTSPATVGEGLDENSHGGGEPEKGDDPTPLSENAKACLATVASLSEATEENQTVLGVHRRIGEVLACMGMLEGLARSNSLPQPQVDESRETLLDALVAAQDQALDILEAEIDGPSQLDEDTDDESEDARDEVIEALRLRVDASLTEAERLRDELGTTQEETKAVQDMLSEVEAERDEFEAEAGQLREQLEETQHKLKVATSVISNSTMETEVNPKVSEAVDAAIDQHPHLERFRSLLERAEDPADVRELAEEMTVTSDPVTESHDDPPATTAPATAFSQRRSLPVGLVESETTAGKAVSTHNPSRGARIAAQAVKANAPR